MGDEQQRHSMHQNKVEIHSIRKTDTGLVGNKSFGAVLPLGAVHLVVASRDVSAVESGSQGTENR